VSVTGNRTSYTVLKLTNASFRLNHQLHIQVIPDANTTGNERKCSHYYFTHHRRILWFPFDPVDPVFKRQIRCQAPQKAVKLLVSIEHPVFRLLFSAEDAIHFLFPLEILCDAKCMPRPCLSLTSQCSMYPSTISIPGILEKFDGHYSTDMHLWLIDMSRNSLHYPNHVHSSP